MTWIWNWLRRPPRRNLTPFGEALWQNRERHKGHPNTFEAAGGTGESGAPRDAVFDPAVLQFRHAYRPSEPAFADATAASRWRSLRRRAMEHVLRRIVASPWNDHLVLRGSLVMRAWFGDTA